ncbi:MAG: hypothetical protein IH874_03160 [Candidatus Dadabacteria bacterium]|nr:hypothetical protein [Candidatus Dadabacteria bacterium]
MSTPETWDGRVGAGAECGKGPATSRSEAPRRGGGGQAAPTQSERDNEMWGRQRAGGGGRADKKAGDKRAVGSERSGRRQPEPEYILGTAGKPLGNDYGSKYASHEASFRKVPDGGAFVLF